MGRPELLKANLRTSLEHQMENPLGDLTAFCRDKTDVLLTPNDNDSSRNIEITSAGEVKYFGTCTFNSAWKSLLFEIDLGIEVPQKRTRSFGRICTQLTQGMRDEKTSSMCIIEGSRVKFQQHLLKPSDQDGFTHDQYRETLSMIGTRCDDLYPIFGSRTTDTNVLPYPQLSPSSEVAGHA